LRDYLVNRARTFLFSTAPVPAAAAAATAAIRLVQSQAGETLRGQLWQNVHAVTSDAELQPRVHRFPPTPMPSSPILPLMVGAETKAVDLAARLREQGLYIPAIRYPTVARGAARLRLTLTAAHTAEDLARLLPALKGCLP
jgi:7-keto-8-aminopelargonate synthetase-like enzyme